MQGGKGANDLRFWMHSFMLIVPAAQHSSAAPVTKQIDGDGPQSKMLGTWSVDCFACVKRTPEFAAGAH